MRLVYFLIILFTINSAFSQSKYKIEIGTSLSAFSNEKVSSNLGISLGVFTQFRLSKNFNAVFGTNYCVKRGLIDISSVGMPDAGSNISEMKIDTEIHYIELPFFIKYRFINNTSFQSSFYTGLSYNLAIYDNSKTRDKKILYSWENYSREEWESIKYKYFWEVESAPLLFSSSGFGYHFGIGLRIMNISVDIRYFRDLQGLEATQDINVKRKKINSVNLILGYNF